MFCEKYSLKKPNQQRDLLYGTLLDQSTKSTFFYERSEYAKAISHKIYNFSVLGQSMHMGKAKFDESLDSSNNYLSLALSWKYGRKYNYDRPTNHLRHLLLFCTTKRNCCIVLCTVYLYKSL